MKDRIIRFLIYLLSGVVQLTIILAAEIIAEYTFSRGAWVPVGIVLFAPVYLVIFLLLNIIFVVKKNKKWLKILDYGFLCGLFLELSGIFTPVLLYLFGLTGKIYNVSIIRELMGL